VICPPLLSSKLWQHDELPVTWLQGSLIGVLLLLVVVIGISLALEDTPSQILQGTLQAGWDVAHRNGMYEERTHVYVGSPILAIAAAPFGYSRIGHSSILVPFPLTRVMWFFVNVISFWLATHWLVRLLETSILKEYSISQQRWWLHRILPLLLIFIPLTDSLRHGYADGVLLLVVSGLIVSLNSRQFFASGLALAGAICLQFTSLALIFVPIWRRDRVMTLGIVVGLFLLLFLLPGLRFGLGGTNRLNEQYLAANQLDEQNTMNDHRQQSFISLVNLNLQVMVLLSLISCGLMGFSTDSHPLRLLHFIGSLLAIMLLADSQPGLHSSTILLPSIVGFMGMVWNPSTNMREKCDLSLLLAMMIALISISILQPLLLFVGAAMCWLLNACLLYRSQGEKGNEGIVPKKQIDHIPALPKAA